MRMMQVSGDEQHADKRSRGPSRVDKLAISHFLAVVFSVVPFILLWAGGFHLTYTDTANIDRNYEAPVLWALFIALLMIYALTTGIGLLLRKPSARSWSRFMPFMTLPLWAMLYWYVAFNVTLSRHYGHRVWIDPDYDGVIQIRDFLTAALILLPFWCAVSVLYWRMLNSPKVEESIRQEYRPQVKSSARTVKALLVVIGVVLLLRCFKMGDGRMLLHDATSYGWTPVVALYLHLGQNVNTRDHNGRTPLHYAVENGRLAEISYLLDCGADINAKDRYGTTALMIAGECDYSPLHYDYSWLPALKMLIERGADVRIRNLQGETVADSISQTDKYNSDAVRTIVERGVPINKRDGDGEVSSPLLAYAVSLGTPRDVDYLLAHGARMYPYLVVDADPAKLKFLLSRGFDVNAKDNEGRTALYYAMQRDSMNETDDGMRLAKMLLQHGADINAVDKQHQTTLHHAADEPDTKWVRFLLENGANPNIRDWGGFTPYDIAERAGWRDVCSIIDEYRVRSVR